ncbi:MAG: class I SAM-dependent methyltransferase [Desulfovibrio sp.]|nr:class I SAM-dependent methyltransferase [Desulfovibrio sp.]
MEHKTFLHVGAGPNHKDRTTRAFAEPSWHEIRLDIDPESNPDILGDMRNMEGVATSSMDAVYSSHNIEHCYAHDVPKALREFLRVLKPEGFLVITCPDLQSVCQLIAQGKLLEACYQAPCGDIAPIDILYGHRASLARGNTFMAHKCGFTKDALVLTLQEVGFAQVASMRREAPFFDLFALATKTVWPKDVLEQTARAHFPG